MSSPTEYRYSHTIGFYSNSGGRGFNSPVDVALGRDEVLYVLNRGDYDYEERFPSKTVTICNVAEDFLGQFGSGGTGDGELMWPASIAIDRDENLYISDEALHRISIFSKDGRFQGRWGVKGEWDGEFNRPAGMAFDGNDDLLVVDGLNHRIQKYTKSGRFLGGWGSRGTGDGEFNMPWGIAVDLHGDVYVSDWRNDRVQKFDPDGRHLASWGTSGQGDGEFHRPAGVAVDLEGNIYIADWGNERVQVLAPDGSFLAKLRGESGVSRWGNDYFISNQDELEEREQADLEPELELPATGYFREESANIEKLFWGPTSVRVDTQGRLFVVESCRYRIQIYQKKN